MKEKKKSPLFELLNFICTKQYTWEDLPYEYKQGYSQFMINRFMSSYEYLLPLLNELTTKQLSNEQHYKILYEWVKKTKHYFNYNAYKVEKIDPNLLISLKKEYNIGTKEAKRYNELLNDSQREFLINKWSDYIKYVANKNN